jgi:hypothetical protein
LSQDIFSEESIDQVLCFLTVREPRFSDNCYFRHRGVVPSPLGEAHIQGIAINNEVSPIGQKALAWRRNFYMNNI